MAVRKGWKEIIPATNRSRETLLKMAHEQGYPLSYEEGQWVLDEELVREWRRKRVEEGKNLPVNY